MVLLGPDGVGTNARAARAARADAWLSELFARVDGLDRCALVAVGGYGRGEMAPGSDLDVLLLHSAELDVSREVEKLWYPIWDAKVRLDHSVRTVVEARSLASRDITVLMGLLDARTICGDSQLVASAKTQILADWRAGAARRVDELRAGVDERIARSGDLAHLVEPDLKESYGGLRELSVMRALAAGWMTDVRADLHEPAHVLLDARDALHTVTGRASDRLSQQEQADVAAMLGYSDADDLLRAVSRAARAIAHACDGAWHVASTSQSDSGINRRRFRVGSRSHSGRRRVPLAEGVVIDDGVVVLAQDAVPASDPVLPLRAAAAAAQAGLRLSPHTVERLRNECGALAIPWPREAREALITLLGAGRRTIPVWEALDQAGLITELLPEWDVVRGAPQRDPMHRFTVDRHLLETAIEASALIRNVSRPDLLLIGALLHDIGKARAGDHSEVGAQLVADIAPRMGFSTDDAAVIRCLVAQHLLLPQLATRRDIDDPATVRAVIESIGASSADVAGSIELLHMLAVADARATGPSVSSEWRLSLIAGLAQRVIAELHGVAEPALPTVSFSGPMPAPGDVFVDIDAVEPPFHRVVVAVADQRGLLSTLANVFAIHRLDVRAARTISLADHAVFEWFVTPMYGQAPERALLREDMRRALAGSWDLEARLARMSRPRREGAVPPTRATVHPDASDRATVVEVRAHDAPGLLGRLAGAVAACGVDVVAARVDTLGSDIVDTFYVVSSGGAPLSESEAEGLRAALEGVV